jgi:hypothetical protein
LMTTFQVSNCIAWMGLKCMRVKPFDQLQSSAS